SGAESLSIEAANSLLKTLEEPSASSIIILVTDKPDALPKTIISRCQIIEFFPVPFDDILNFVETNSETSDRQKILKICKLSAGRPGLAWQYLHIPEILSQREEINTRFIKALGTRLIGQFRYLENEIESQSFQEGLDKANDSLDNWIKTLRDMLMEHYHLDVYQINSYLKTDLEKLAYRYPTRLIVELINYLFRLKQRLAVNLNPRLALENFFLNT
ncbi:MAG: hypothetical protein PHH01_05150, partial [Patescibacteria group bacterium]|nr:hypothetical protein [Patescibacteria group bacterium]